MSDGYDQKASDRRRIIPVPMDQWDEKTAKLIANSSVRLNGASELFSTMARHPRLLLEWARFSGGLLFRSHLDRRLVELVILRTALNCHCDYELQHHLVLGREAGLTPKELDAVMRPLSQVVWPMTEGLLLRAADELNADQRIGDDTWRELSATLDDVQLIELCMTIGQYTMLAMLINSAGVQLERDVPTPNSLA